MFPPVHAGVGYLAYRAILAASERGSPTGPAVAAVVFGSLLPELVDQPQYYALGLSSTRTLAHSLVVVVPVSLVALVLAARSRRFRTVGPAVAVGYLVHPFTDALWPAVLGLWAELGFLLWPLTHSPAYQGQKVLGSIGGLEVTTLWVELPILAVAVLVWWRDGTPGVDLIGSYG